MLGWHEKRRKRPDFSTTKFDYKYIVKLEYVRWLQGSVARKVDNFIHRIVTFPNFLNMFSNFYNPDKKSLFSS